MPNSKVKMQKSKVERHAAIKQIRFTKEGLEKLKKEYETLQKERPDAVMHLKKAREMGDLSENGYYKASRARLSAIDGQLWRISMQLKYAVVTENNGGDIDIGCTVTFSNGQRELTYQIVGDLEANPSEGKLSLNSPIGKALAGHQQGEEVDIITPAGTTRYKILKVTW